MTGNNSPFFSGPKSVQCVVRSLGHSHQRSLNAWSFQSWTTASLSQPGCRIKRSKDFNHSSIPQRDFSSPPCRPYPSLPHGASVCLSCWAPPPSFLCSHSSQSLRLAFVLQRLPLHPFRALLNHCRALILGQSSPMISSSTRCCRLCTSSDISVSGNGELSHMPFDSQSMHGKVRVSLLINSSDASVYCQLIFCSSTMGHAPFCS